MLRADRDQDLLRCGPHTAPRQHAGMELFDQQRVVAVHAITCPVADRRDAECLARAFAPVGDREQGRVELPVDERVGVLLPIAWFDDVALQRWTELQTADPIRCRSSDVLDRTAVGDPTDKDVLVDVVTAALVCNQVALVHELLISYHHRIAGDAELGREPAAGGEGVAAGNVSVQNRRHQHFPDLGLQARSACGREIKQWIPHRLV